MANYSLSHECLRPRSLTLDGAWFVRSVSNIDGDDLQGRSSCEIRCIVDGNGKEEKEKRVNGNHIPLASGKDIAVYARKTY